MRIRNNYGAMCARLVVVALIILIFVPQRCFKKYSHDNIQHTKQSRRGE